MPGSFLVYFCPRSRAALVTTIIATAGRPLPSIWSTIALFQPLFINVCHITPHDIGPDEQLRRVGVLWAGIAELHMDVSTFVRELFIDALVIYGTRDRIMEALREMGQSHRIKQGPGLVLEMADHWRELEHEKVLELLKQSRTRPAEESERIKTKR